MTPRSTPRRLLREAAVLCAQTAAWTLLLALLAAVVVLGSADLRAFRYIGF